MAPVLKCHYGSCTWTCYPYSLSFSFAVGTGLAPSLGASLRGTELRLQVRCFNPCIRSRSQKMINLNDIQSALRRIRSSIYLSPCARSETFSESTGNQVYLKLDNLQRTGAFKERGALNKLLSLSDDEKRRGVIAASAGNHAQAVAYHATQRGVLARIVMPLMTPLVKISAT